LTIVADNGASSLELSEGRVPVTLFAGGTTGLLLLDTTGREEAFWTALGERVETGGLSALAFAGPVPGDATEAAVLAGRRLAQLGVEQVVVVAAGDNAPAALRAAAGGGFAAVVLVDPAIAAEDVAALLEDAPLAKLVLVAGNDSQAQRTAELVFENSIGPTVIWSAPRRQRGLPPLREESGQMLAETILEFVVSVCGDGRRI
jgi:hypothetical protein